MKQLSNLETLYVGRCNRLQSLTEIPSHLITLSATDCKELRSIPDASKFVEWLITRYGNRRSSHKEYSQFIFTNCLKLDEKAFGNILERLITQRIAMKVLSRVQICFCYPGKRVPEWFYQASGSSIDIKRHDDDDFNGQILGFAACAAIELEERVNEHKPSVYCRCINLRETHGAFWRFDEYIDSDHMVLGYFDIPVSKETNFKFDFECPRGSGGVIKRCGVFPIFANGQFKEKSFAVQPTYEGLIEVSGINIRDTGETSKKRKSGVIDLK